MSKIAKTIAVLGVVAGLGVAALPMSTYAAEYSRSASAIVTTEVEGAISIATSVDATGGKVDLGKLALNSETTEMTDPLAVTVTSNSAQTYSLGINALNGETAMKGAKTGATIPAGTPAAGTSAWGYATDAETAGTYSAYAAVPATLTEVKQFTTAANTGDDADTNPFINTTNFKFKASANGTQTPDTYEATVVFTATVNN